MTSQHGTRLSAPPQVWIPISLVWIVLAVIAVGALTSPLPGSAGKAIAVPLGVLAVGLIGYRTRSMAIDVDADRVVLRNLVRTTILPWDRIDEVLAVRGLGLGTAVGFRLRGESGFLSRLPAAVATSFGGQIKERGKLLEELRLQCEGRGVRCRLILDPHGTWRTRPD